MSAPLKWEFPGGKVRPLESPQSALVREIREELSLDIEVGDHLGRGVHGRVSLSVFRALVIGGRLELLEHSEVRWIGAESIDSLDWADADRPVLARLRIILSDPH